MELRELHEIATMYTNIAEALSFAKEFAPKGADVDILSINTDNPKSCELHIRVRYGDNERELVYDYDVDYRRSIMIEEITNDIRAYVAECLSI